MGQRPHRIAENRTKNTRTHSHTHVLITSHPFYLTKYVFSFGFITFGYRFTSATALPENKIKWIYSHLSSQLTDFYLKVRNGNGWIVLKCFCIQCVGGRHIEWKLHKTFSAKQFPTSRFSFTDSQRLLKTDGERNRGWKIENIFAEWTK